MAGVFNIKNNNKIKMQNLFSQNNFTLIIVSGFIIDCKKDDKTTHGQLPEQFKKLQNN